MELPLHPGRLCIRLLTCSLHRPHRLTRSISTRPHTLPYKFPPPCRRNYEYTLPDPHPPTKDKNSKLDRRPTNRQIPFDHVFLLDPDTNKRSRTKHALKDLLEAYLGEGRVVELVSSAPDPIVRVTTRAEVEARYREMRRAIKKGARGGEEPKEVQFTWGVASADLEHKLRKARRDLERGYRVVVMVSMKTRHRPSSPQELVAFADEISETLADLGEEWKEREFTQRLMMMSFRKIERLDNDIS